MPSDPRVQLALGAVAKQIATYRASVTTAAERVRGLLTVGGSDRARAELGVFGISRIDASRFAELERGTALDLSARSVMMRAAEVLQEISELPDSAFVVAVPSGDRAAVRIDSLLARFGRLFGAMHAVALARAGRLDEVRNEFALRHGFDRWSTTERLTAPPIVLVANGADLNPGELSVFLDGSLHLAIVVEGASTPALLTRLITPGTFVMQTIDGRALDRFGSFAGPAVAALVDERAACFVHDPAAGASPWQRIDVWKQPSTEQRKRIGHLSARQQREEIAQLSALAAQPMLSHSPLGDLLPTGADEVNRLTEWLLTESGLTTSAPQ
jgi:hypothetical protein